ncbi:MAG: glycoside hydrolase family 130 protein [Armatimonadetes bacterium]|nr:glycoside hydrolase family 130 protein [Armatimonadota bacterium]
MAKSSIKLNRLPHRITPNPGRVITRFFGADEASNQRRIQRILGTPESRVDDLLETLRASYTATHPDIDEIWLENYNQVKSYVPSGSKPDDRRKKLIGAYFTMEYAIEAAALFNPSIIPAIDQSNLPEGSTRFLMSLRATGEGHLSSVVFRMGVIDQDNNIIIEEPSLVCRRSQIEPNGEFDTEFFRQALVDLDALGSLEKTVLDSLGPTFSLKELHTKLQSLRKSGACLSTWKAARENMMTLAASNYVIRIPSDTLASEVVIFPVSERESHGIEDLRLVRFTDDDGSKRIYGTYTAYNGMTGFPSLFITSNFTEIESHSMAGAYSRNKGMALFPRRINGKYVMSGRLDGENLFIMDSDSPLVWTNARPSEEPMFWWEYSIIGNCGSPVETPEGWLMLTHGVGPMRQYSIGAALLDLDDPARVIARSEEPLIIPSDEDRRGYVPNVVYTCGSMLHNDVMIIPYAVSDFATTFACVPLDDLISGLKRL